MARPKGRRYQRLADYLTEQSADEVTLSFAEVEALVGAALPTSAYLRDWWRNKGTRQIAAQPWRVAGWEAVALTPRAGEWRVTFRRRSTATDDNR